MKVETPLGTWVVRRRWVPRQLGNDSYWSRFRSRNSKARRRMSEGADLLDAGDGCLPDLGEGIAIALLVIAAALLFIFLGIPLLIALGELALLLVLFVIGVVTKVVFRRPWTVEAIDHTGERHAWRVVGWRASGEVRNLVAERVTTTGAVPTIAEVSMMAGVVAE